MEKDLHSKVDARLGLSVQDITTDTTTSGGIIDTALFESAYWAILSGTLTDGDYACAIWESDDSGMADATVVPSEETLGAANFAFATDDDTVKRIGSVGKKRYQQLRIVSTTTTTGGTNFVSLVTMSDPRHGPVASTT